jgi:hypothetical protein
LQLVDLSSIGRSLKAFIGFNPESTPEFGVVVPRRASAQWFVESSLNRAMWIHFYLVYTGDRSMRRTGGMACASVIGGDAIDAAAPADCEVSPTDRCCRSGAAAEERYNGRRSFS